MALTEVDRARTYLDEFVARTPEQVRHVARYFATQAQDILETVAGDPDALWRAATRADTAAASVHTLVEGQVEDRTAAGAAEWTGVTATSFDRMLGEADKWAEELTGGLGKIAAALVDAQKSSTDAINLLLELIFDVTAAFFAEVIAAAAAGLLTAGLSLAAFVLRWLARFALTLKRMAEIVGTLAKALRAIMRRLEDLATWFAGHRRRMAALKAAKPNGIGEWVFKKTEIAAETFVPLGIVNYFSPVNIPGFVGTGVDAFAGVPDLLYDGRKDRNYVLDGTFRDDIKNLPQELQDLIDSISF